ncbi:hypothetical protein EV368DRAFT_70481 [Lentinula lateritia]|nr:hypothetical protein EV368DRAFT_70481 [Lentinula lateritia]
MVKSKFASIAGGVPELMRARSAFIAHRYLNELRDNTITVTKHWKSTPLLEPATTINKVWGIQGSDHFRIPWRNTILSVTNKLEMKFSDNVNKHKLERQTTAGLLRMSGRMTNEKEFEPEYEYERVCKKQDKYERRGAEGKIGLCIYHDVVWTWPSMVSLEGEEDTAISSVFPVYNNVVDETCSLRGGGLVEEELLEIMQCL